MYFQFQMSNLSNDLSHTTATLQDGEIADMHAYKIRSFKQEGKKLLAWLLSRQTQTAQKIKSCFKIMELSIITDRGVFAMGYFNLQHLYSF